jgi:hypothetical protein
MSEPISTGEPQESLTEQELNELSGGLNPQPLPPHNPPPDQLRG